LRDYEAVSVVEALRSGVASRRLSAIFSYGREALLEQVEQDLEASAAGVTRCLLLRGNFGEGKTHFLNCVYNRAQERNFVVSFVALSKETPFNRLDRVYPKIVAGTYLPHAADPGVEGLIQDLRPGSEVAGELLAFAEQNLHPKISFVLRNYLEGGDTYQQHLLYSDLAGEWLPLSQLKSLHRLNFGVPARIERFRSRIDVWDYFRFLSQLIKLRGYAGWVILFDEFELVATLGIAARSEAYCNLGHFLFPDEKTGLPFTYTIFSIAAEFWPAVLVPLRRRRADPDQIPARFFAQGEAAKAETAKRVLNTLLRDIVTLESLPRSEVRRLLEAVCDLHARAYGWTPTVDVDHILEATKADRLRTKIRYALEYLDLKYLYGEEPLVHIGRLEVASAGGTAGAAPEEGDDSLLPR